jgi:3-phenylpropionate/trans-cinnamate dioxygenase ferredoxin reductase subunit
MMTRPNAAASSPVVIVGAGHAGGRTAQALRRLGYSGPVTLVGEEPYLPYERPPLSKELLLGRVEPESLFLLGKAQWDEIDVDLRLGARIQRIDPVSRRVLVADGSELAYAHLVIATGARARSFPGPVVQPEQVHYLRTIEDALRLRKGLATGQRLAIVGAGFIGLELAACASQLGVSVTLIESAPRPLPRLLPTAVGRWLVGLHANNSVNILLNRKVARIDADAILLEDGMRVPFDCVTVGIGAEPNVELAQAAGLDVRDGIVVDQDCRSSDPSIFAIGDVARWVHPLSGVETRLEAWRNAEDQAQRVASVLCGIDEAVRLDPPWFWSDQYGRNIQLAGWPSDDCDLVEHGDPETGPWLCYYLQDSRVRGVIGIDCGREVRGAQQLIREGVPVVPSVLRGPRMKVRKAPSTV